MSGEQGVLKKTKMIKEGRFEEGDIEGSITNISIHTFGSRVRVLSLKLKLTAVEANESIKEKLEKL